MNIQVKTDKSSELTAFRLKGELDFNEFLAFVETHHKQTAHTKKCIWDFLSVTGGERVSVLQMGQLYGLCKEYFYGESAHRIAFVINEEMGFGLARVYSAFAHSSSQYIKIFREKEKAIQWLRND